MNDDVRDEDRELLERAEVADAYTWGKWVRDHVVIAELRDLVPALAARVRELSAMVRRMDAKVQEAEVYVRMMRTRHSDAPCTDLCIDTTVNDLHPILIAALSPKGGGE